MAPFSFLKSENLAELARQFELKMYAPSLELVNLVTGVDNVRYDVSLSPMFVEAARQHIARIIAKAGGIEDLLAVPTDQPARAGELRPVVHKTPAIDATEYKKRLAELQVSTLNRAKSEGNTSLDLLARIAIIKFLRSELT